MSARPGPNGSSAKDQGVVSAGLACPEERCGQPQTSPGRPRRGWVQVKAAAAHALWFCSWHCVSRHALRRELRGDT